MKNSTLGYKNFRLGAAGFLLFFSLLGLSAQASISPSTAPEAPKSPIYPSEATLTEKLTMMLESWVTWYKTIYMPWSETDRQWKQELSVSWKNLIDSLTNQNAELAALRIENETLRQQLKQAQGERWIFGAVGAGGGVAVLAISQAIVGALK